MLNVRIATPPWDRNKNYCMDVNPGIASSYIYSKKAGAKVTLVSGPTHIEAPKRAQLIWVASAEEMYDEVQKLVLDADIFIGVAAVADYRPKTVPKSMQILWESSKPPETVSDRSWTRLGTLLARLGGPKEARKCGFAEENVVVLKRRVLEPRTRPRHFREPT